MGTAERLRAECIPTIEKLIAGNGTSADEAGDPVAVFGSRVVVGAPGYGVVGQNEGAAYVFRRTTSGWIQEQQLIPSQVAADDKFGKAVAIFDDLILVGARGQGDSGAAFVFRFNGQRWVEEARLTPSDGGVGDSFGLSVALARNVALIGAYAADDYASNAGAAYAFRFDGTRWVEEAKLIASDAAASDYFGVAVALDNDVAVVGAYLDDDLGSASGSAYVFRYRAGEWTEESKIVPADGVAGERFGGKLDVSADRVVVGIEQNDDLGVNTGAAYVFAFDGVRWAQQAKLYASNATGSSFFGASVGISGDSVVVGAYGYASNDRTESGVAYAFRFDGVTWHETNVLEAPDGWYWDYFGRAVAIDGDVGVVGAPGEDSMGNNSGSAYVFEFECPTSGCLSDGDCDDASFCNGAERCVSGSCQSGTAPCGGGLCSELTDACVECLTNADCDDGAFCNGSELCVGGSCRSGSSPCDGGLCNEVTNACVDCLSNADCDDGAFCNGSELCVGGSCRSGSSSCDGRLCNEVTNVCVDCLSNADCDDGAYCNGSELCVGGSCRSGLSPCGGNLCIESSDNCLDCRVDGDCDDGNPCTDDLCDPVVGCRSANNTNGCEFGGTCFGSGVCNAGACTCVEDPILKDLPAFLNCMRGPNLAALPRCRGFDANGDNAIDMRDFGDLDLLQ